MKYRDNVTDYLPEFVDALTKQLDEDQKRWGDTWKHRPKEGQESRIEKDFMDYFDKYKHANKPVNWLAVCGNALIAWIREYETEEK